jgi:hypothetical protein
MRESGWLGDRALVEMDVRLVRAGQGSADVLVFRGPPRDIADLGSPIEADRVVLEEIDRTPARFIAIAVLFAVLVIGLMVEATLHGRREQRDRERTLRRFTIALPAGLRRELEALSADATASGARALRDRLSALAPLARSAVFSRWRADPKAIDARRAALCAELTSRTGRARQSTYRAAADGLALVTILIRHRCELPELPEGLDALHLALALDSSLPRDDEELAGVDVIWHPRDPSESLDEREVAAVFPELVALDAAATARCAACEAPVAHGHASCTACGASLASG